MALGGLQVACRDDPLRCPIYSLFSLSATHSLTRTKLVGPTNEKWRLWMDGWMDGWVHAESELSLRLLERLPKVRNQMSIIHAPQSFKYLQHLRNRWRLLRTAPRSNVLNIVCFVWFRHISPTDSHWRVSAFAKPCGTGTATSLSYMNYYIEYVQFFPST